MVNNDVLFFIPDFGNLSLSFFLVNVGKSSLIWLIFSKNQHFIFYYLFIFVVRRPLTVVASPIAEHRLRKRRLSGRGSRAHGLTGSRAHGLTGSRAQPLRGTWHLPGPGHEPASPALAGGLPTTAPPGKPE